MAGKKVRDADSRERILDAAIVEFGEYGLAGARIDRIAERSGFNKAMIYYHFKGKEELYREVIRLFFTHILDILKKSNNAELPVEKRLVNMYKALGEMVKTLDQNMRRLFLWEMASGSGLLSAEEIKPYLKALFEQVSSVYSQAEKEKVIRKVKPLPAHMMMLGSIVMGNLMLTKAGGNPFFRLITGIKDADEIQEAALDILKNGIWRK